MKGNLTFGLMLYGILCVTIAIGNYPPPDSAAAWNENGTALYNQGKYSEALHAFNNALEFNSSSPQIWYNKGNALYSQGNYDEALEAYDKVLELDPLYTYAWLAKGKSLYYLKKYEEAIQALDEAIKLNPQDAEAMSIKEKAQNTQSTMDQAYEPYPTTAAKNRPPVLAQLNSDYLSPQDAGTDIVWTASALDPDGDMVLYMFLLNDKPVTVWNLENTWTWMPSENNEGKNQIEVRVRDGLHAGPDDFDDDISSSFSINRIEVRSHVAVLGGSKRYSYIPGPAFSNHKASYVPGPAAYPIVSI